MSVRTHDTLRRYGGALLLVGAATLVRFALAPVAGDALPLLFYFVAAAFAGWFFGLGPALACAAVGYACGEWLFVPGRGPLYASGPLGLVQVSLYALMTLGLAVGVRVLHERRESLQRAYADLERHHRTLEAGAADRVRIERALRESEQKFARAFASSPVAFVIRPRAASPNWRSASGRTTARTGSRRCRSSRSTSAANRACSRSCGT